MLPILLSPVPLIRGLPAPPDPPLRCTEKRLLKPRAGRTCRTPPPPRIQTFQAEQGRALSVGASSAPTAQVRERTKCGAGPSAAKPRPGLSAHPEGSQAPWGPAARPAGGVSGQRRPAGRPRSEGPPPRALGFLWPRLPLTGAGARLPDLQQQDDDGRQVGQVPGQPEDVHGGGGRRSGPGARRLRRRRRRLRGRGEDGESGSDVARDVAELPARAQGSLGERAASRPRPFSAP